MPPSPPSTPPPPRQQQQYLLLLLLLLLPTCFCIAPHFREELSQLQEHDLPSCPHHNPPLRTWTFPVAALVRGGMVWSRYVPVQASKGLETASKAHALDRDRLLRQQQQQQQQQHQALSISEPVSDTTVFVAPAQMAHGYVLQVAGIACLVMRVVDNDFLCRFQRCCLLLLLLLLAKTA
jgi:hypothetical protein